VAPDPTLGAGASGDAPSAWWLGTRWLPAEGPDSLLAGEHGLTYLAYGTRVPSDICFYPRSGKVNIGRMTFRLSPTDYWEGEEDGA